MGRHLNETVELVQMEYSERFSSRLNEVPQWFYQSMVNHLRDGQNTTRDFHMVQYSKGFPEQVEAIFHPMEFLINHRLPFQSELDTNRRLLM